MKRGIVVFLTLLAILLLTVKPGQAFNCNEAMTSLIPCVGYLTGSGDPSADCCTSMSDLKSSILTKDDKLAACECLKETLSTIREDLIASLPERCGVDIGFTISKNIECNNIP